jgi:hypothetical protein
MGNTISNIINGIDNNTKHILYEIDPTILKLKNTTLNLVNELERRIDLNTEEYLISLRENLLVWFLLMIIFVILIFTLIYNLNDILYKFKINSLIRQYIILLVVTIITFWIFLSLICLIFVNEQIDWFILKLIIFSLFSLFLLLFIFIWFRFFFIYQKRIKNRFLKKQINISINYI